MEDFVYFSFYYKEKLSEYKCTTYRIPSNAFYNILKENKKDYLKLFSSRPEQIIKYLKYLGKIANVEIKIGTDLSKFLSSFTGS